MKTREIAANGLTFRAREHGAGTPVLLLHGFPETSRMWEPLMERLAAEGFHCLAPDQRGYSPGARPESADNYTYDHLTADTLAFIEAMGWQRAHLIGHDWGAIVGWATVDSAPDRIMSWTPLSVPHLKGFGGAIRGENEDQRRKSSYILFFLQVGTAEAALSANDYAALRALYQKTHSPDAVQEYIDVLSQDGALTAALNYYRGTAGIQRERGVGREFAPVSVPTLHIWGKSDPAIGRDATIACREFMTGPYELMELDCGHWIVQEALDQIAGPIIDHLRKYS